ncbi:MAG: phosphate acyltransferase PlsX [Verrucomicrobiota bacterium]
MKIALDAMGGDFAPGNPVAGAIDALSEFPQIEELILVGDEPRIRMELSKLGVSKTPDRISINHCSEVIEMCEPAVAAVRKKKDSSINRTIELVKEGRALAAVSAGNTGAMTACSSLRLRTLPGVPKAGIAALMPTETNVFVLLDVGANVDARAEHLTIYGIMGSIYSKSTLGFTKPRVGLLSVGTEDAKGNDLTKEAFKMLRSAPVNFIGNIEGRDLYENPVEVVVTDGFTGNVVLKTSESIAHSIFSWLKHELNSTPTRLFGAWLARKAFAAIKKKTNYEEYGGSLLLGLNGTVVIAHGSSTPLAMKNAIRVAAQAIEKNINHQIIEQVSQFKEHNKKGLSLAWKK